MKRPRLVPAIFVIVLGLAAHASACGSEARATDACRRLESARCERAPACPVQYADFTKIYGTVESCKKFYDVQCGRGIQEIAKEPSKSELEACVGQIKSSCEAVGSPEKFCPFLTANDRPAEDTGSALVPETGAEASTDAGDGG